VKSKDLTNKRFGKLIATSLAENTKFRSWNCTCDCGVKKIIYQTHLIQGNIVSCGCIKRNSSSKCWTGYGEISGDVWGEIKRKSSKRRFKNFNITLEQAWNLFLEQNRKCKLSGLPIFFGETNEIRRSASLDRIDSSGDYTIDNVQWVHKKINIMKNRLDQNYFIYLCNIVTNPLPLHIEVFTKITNISNDKWADICRGKQKCEFTIDKDYIINLYNKQNGLCNLTNTPIFLNIGGSDELPVASLDRIDSQSGYIDGNVHWVHKTINLMKNVYSLNEFKYFCKCVSETNNINK
jgi:hypothetical protein